MDASRIVTECTDAMHLDRAHPFVRDAVHIAVQRLLAAAGEPALLAAWTQLHQLTPIPGAADAHSD